MVHISLTLNLVLAWFWCWTSEIYFLSVTSRDTFYKISINVKKEERPMVNFFCTKTIHLFKCSPAQVHTKPLSSLWTLNKGMGQRMTATFAVWTGLEENHTGHKTVMTERKSHRALTVSLKYWPALTSKMKCCFWFFFFFFFFKNKETSKRQFKTTFGKQTWRILWHGM